MTKIIFLKKDVLPLLKLSIPLVLTSFMQGSLGFFENIFLAHLGQQVLAAGALVAWLFATLIVILFGTFSSVNILIAHKYGAKDNPGITHVFRDGLVLALFLVVPTFLLLWYTPPIFLLFGQSPALVKLATAYLHALAWSLFPKFILIVLFEFLLGLGRTRVLTVFTVFSLPFYLLFSYVLIFGKFGFPALGIAGAGWGMVLGDWLATTALGLYVFFNQHYQCYLKSLFTFTRPTYLWELLHLGVPMGLMYCVEVGFFFSITLFMGVMGVQTLAANQLAMQYLGPLMGMIFSLAQGVTIRMGHQLGAEQPASAERTAFAGLLLGALFMSLIAITYWSFPYALIAIDFNVHLAENEETVYFAKQFLFIAAFFQLFESARVMLFGALRSLKDTRFTLLVSILSFWCIALPLGYMFAHYIQLGGAGFWWGMVIGASCSAPVLYSRFRLKMKSYHTAID